jgi:hypothetical protein
MTMRPSSSVRPSPAEPSSLPAAEELARLLAEHGPGPARDAAYLERLMGGGGRFRGSARQEEAEALAAAVRGGIPAALAAKGESADHDALAARLAWESGLDPTVARTAVRTWADVLGRSAPSRPAVKESRRTAPGWADPSFAGWPAAAPSRLSRLRGLSGGRLGAAVATVGCGLLAGLSVMLLLAAVGAVPVYVLAGVMLHHPPAPTVEGLLPLVTAGAAFFAAVSVAGWVAGVGAAKAVGRWTGLIDAYGEFIPG